MSTHIDTYAERLDTAALKAEATAQISLENQLSIDEAYQIQKASIDRRIERGESLTGYKLGFTSRAKMEQMGLDEIIFGRLTDQMDIKKGPLELSNRIHPRVEPELAFRIKKDIDKVLDPADAPEYIDAVCIALEVIDSRFENFKFDLADVIADNCSSSAYLLGPWLDPKTDIRNKQISYSLNGENLHTGSTDAILGNPYDALIEVSKMSIKYDAAIKAGHIILAGAATAASYVSSGDHLKVSFSELGDLSLDIK